MDPFKLGPLPPHLLEKVITKIEEERYFRLQQTCRWIYAFIRTCPNISVHVDATCRLKFYKRKPIWEIDSNKYTSMEAEGYYGTRLGKFRVIRKTKKCKLVCKSLRENKITCYFLELCNQVWTKKQCVEIIKTLKPVKVFMDSLESTHYEALSGLENVKSVVLQLSVDDVPKLAPELLSTYEEVGIELSLASSPFDLLRTVLTLLFHEPFSRLREFHLGVKWGNARSMLSEDELVKEFPDYELRFGWDRWKLDAVIRLPQQFPLGSSCRVIIQNQLNDGLYIKVLYQVSPQP